MKNVKTLILLGALVFAGTARAQSCAEDVECMNGKIAASQILVMDGQIEKMEKINGHAIKMAEQTADDDGGTYANMSMVNKTSALVLDAYKAVKDAEDASLNEVDRLAKRVAADLKKAEQIDRLLEQQAELKGVILE